MNTIESSVTRLLVSTKHLLESLTQWARQEADDKFVSDAYVKLGNDFRAATRAFSSAGVDISDLGDVPRALRIVLESALSEAPTQENLDRFLPNIRNIIVNLLLSLKLKQGRANALAEERSAHADDNASLREGIRNMRDDTSRQGINSSQNLSRNELREQITDSHSQLGFTGSIENQITDYKRSSNGCRTQEKSHLDLSPHVDRSPVAEPPYVSSYHDQAPIENNESSMEPSADRALAQLQKNNVILRRASKRFSAYQFAKLANFSGGQLSKLPADAKSLRESLILQRDPPVIPQEDKVEKHTADESALSYIFLRIKDTTKKLHVQLPITMTSLRLLFVEKFAYSPGVALFPDIYIVDPRTSVSYELEDAQIHTELRGGMLVELKDHLQTDVTLESLESKLLKLETQMNSITDKIITEVSERISSIEFKPSSPLPILAQDTGTKVSEPTNLKAFGELQHEVKALKQIHRAKNDALKASLLDLDEQIAVLKQTALESGSQDSHRTFMQHSYSKLSEESDTLLTKVDDLQDIMEALRKDVAQRGVRLGPKQLKATAKEILDAEASLRNLVEYINDGKPSWKKIWESELDQVCEEQQFFNLQDDLTRDLNEDINKIKETFELIEKCCSEQSKQPPKRTMFAGRIPLLEPGDSLHELKGAVLNEVCHLVPDHESRLDAIARAERLRKKEREIQTLDQFEEELGDFVADQKLKKSGGIEEIERKRQEKDLENFKSTFGIV